MCSPDAMTATGGIRGPGMGKTGISLIPGEGNTNTYLNMYGVPADQQRGSDAYVARENAWKEFKKSATDAQLSGDWSTWQGPGGGGGATQQQDPNIKSNLQTKKAAKPKKKKPPTTGGGGLQVPDAGMSPGTGGLNV